MQRGSADLQDVELSSNSHKGLLAAHGNVRSNNHHHDAKNQHMAAIAPEINRTAVGDSKSRASNGSLPSNEFDGRLYHGYSNYAIDESGKRTHTIRFLDVAMANPPVPRKHEQYDNMYEADVKMEDEYLTQFTLSELEPRGALELCFCFSLFEVEDDGVPPPCKISKVCPMHTENACLNTPFFRKTIGRIGFRHFDKQRKLYLGIASIVTIAAMFLTVWGCQPSR